MKRATACWAIAGLLVSLCTLFVLRYGTTHGPAVLVDSGSVAEAADQVMACAVSGDYEALENLLYGAPHLGEAPQKDDSAQGLIWKAYLDSIFPCDISLDAAVEIKHFQHPNLNILANTF